MNRIKLDIIKETTSIPIQQLKQITECNPYSQGWLSQKFPIFPIFLNFHISNPPFNKVSLCLQKPYLPSSLQLQGSSDSKEYFKFGQITDFTNAGNIVLNLKQNHHYRYLRIRVNQPKEEKLGDMNRMSNCCKQVWIRCIELAFVTFYGAEYVCSMEKALVMDPCLFRLLEMLQYKALLAKSKSKNSKKADQYRNMSQKYYKDIEEVLLKIKDWGQNTKKLSQDARENLLQQLDYLSQQPMNSLTLQQRDYDRQGIKKEVQALQNQLQQFYVHRLNNLHKDVTDYFHKYWNKEVKQQYLRLLSSPENEDHGKALTNFWGEVKNLSEFPSNIEEAVVMFFNYFLEYVHDPLKIAAIKILCLLFRNQKLSFQIYFVYERLLFNLYSQLSDQQRVDLVQVSLKCIYTLFQKVPDSLFIQALINPQHSIKFRMKIVKLQILQKLTFKNITVDQHDKDSIIDYILDILSIKQATLIDKNRAYNIIAYLASLYGKDHIMQKIQKLNTMLTMSIQKIIDKKLQQLKVPKKQQQIPICEFCGKANPTFKDPNLYDLHCFKQCKYLTPCQYCSQVIQIPEINKHYIHNCQQRNLFKECQECNQAIMKIKEDQHKKVCGKELVTKCGLCGGKMEGKLKLKEHILKDGCPNNPR